MIAALLRGLALVLVLALAGPALAQTAVPVLRISTENTADHIQTKALQRFVEVVRKAAGGRLDIRLHHSAELYRDRDVIKALLQGKVEMAVPGTWQLDRFQPDMGMFLLPMFYGRSAAVNYALRDGPIGQELNARLESAQGVKVLGRWIDLGFAHIYGVGRPITRPEDLQGLRIRIAGGDANAARLEAFGAIPSVIPWPDLPLALDQGRIDGVLTSHETVASAALWKHGIRYAFEDFEYFPQYVPMVNLQFWNRLPTDLRAVLQASWEEMVEPARTAAAAAQTAARQELARNGVRFTHTSPEQRAVWRERLMTRQPELVRTMGLDEALVEQVRRQLEAIR